MKRIRAFGCSLTQQHHWKYLDIEEIDLKSYAIGSQGNDVQFAQYMNAVHDGDILKDDIIIWQLTNEYRRMVNKPNIDKLLIAEGANTVDEKGYWLDMKNMFCPNKRIQGVVRGHYSLTRDKPHKNEREERLLAEYQWNKINQTGLPIYEMLLQLNGVKRDNDKLLVMFGWNDMFAWDGLNENVFKYLKKQGIDYIEESIYNWVLDQGYKIDNTNHPPQNGYQAYTNNVLSPKLKQLKWLD
ncbi:uncharacterized protein METZ01_LOCUS398117 [marine metagenome]|uniref:SGNH hydrolase-type esterase domain-containing protein n=1 Tax=marine metagenome TaxID=408172 RepID=A0A382VFJ7_9ZZZZ